MCHFSLTRALHACATLLRAPSAVPCRALVQLLLVLDDADLHEHGSPMNLATSRAMASSLNSLVFHTAFPESCRPQVSPAAAVQQQQQQHAKLLPASTAHGRVSEGVANSLLLMILV